MDFDWMFYPKLLLTIVSSCIIGGAAGFGLASLFFWIFA